LADTIRCLWSDESAQDLVEYALLLVLVALTVVVALQLLGSEVGEAMNNAASQTQSDLN